MGAWISPAFSALGNSMRFRMARAAVLAGNLANVDTPGHRRRELHFDGVLGGEIARVNRTHPRHLSTSGSNEPGYRSEIGPPGTRPDGNAIDLDTELIEVNRNAGSFMDQARVMARMTSLMKKAMSGQ